MLLPVLQTKFYVPPLRPQLVRRDQLIDRLQAQGAHPVTLVSAPAGFGKTTLVSAWINRSAGPRRHPGARTAESSETPQSAAHGPPAVAWLSLDDDDNDPTRFLLYLLRALQTRQPTLGETALALLAAPQAPPSKAILTTLLNDLSTLATPLMLVLDDYHLIESQANHHALTFLIDHLPPTLCLVIISRIDPPLPLARWRVRNHLIEVRADDLRFTPAEATTFLNEVMDLSLSTTEITSLETRTEGWIAGLQLAALSLQGRADVTGFIQAFSGSHRHVLSYLVEEVLNRRPEGTLDFLLQTAILDQMSAALCDALTGRNDSRTLLERLERANLFLVPLDDVGEWYRYHHLFAEVLRSRLQHAQPEVIPQLHQRASAWYAAAGQLEQAVGHALAAQDVEQAATLVERVALAAVVQHSEVRLVRGLVERLPVATVYSRPRLTLAYAITLVLSGQFDAVETLLLQAAPVVNSRDLPDEVAGGLVALQATMARLRGDLQRSLDLAHQALHHLPATAQAMRALAALNLGSVYVQQGDRVAASHALADTVTWGSAAGADYIVLAAVEELATEQLHQGHLAQAKQSCEQALARVTRGNSRPVPAAGMLHVILGEVLVEWNELEHATRALTEGVHLLQRTTEMGLLVRGYCALARCQWADGEREAALATLDRGEAWLAQIQTAAPGTHARLAAQRARLHVWQGDLVAALEWEHKIDLLGETILTSFQQLTRVRIRLAQHARDPQASFLREATTILSPLVANADSKGWRTQVVEIVLLQALIARAHGERAAAETTLIRALALAEPAGAIRVFVDEGETVRGLIAGCRFRMAHRSSDSQQQRLLNYIDKVLHSFGAVHAFDGSPSRSERSSIPAPTVVVEPSTIQQLVHPLSAREYEVLRLVNDGRSNTEIAALLIVTVGTVKKHINNIFGKLGVSSRTQALATARELNLL